MILSKKPVLTAIAITSLSLLVASAYAGRGKQPEAPALGVEISLDKPFYIPASTGKKKMSAVVRTPLQERDAGHEAITAVKFAAVMEGDKVRVVVSGLIGDASNVKRCKDWDSLKSVPIDTYVVGL